jgi:hypothetical protein
MRRLATATLAGLTVFGLVNGLAASMEVSSDNLGSASPVTAACDQNGMTMSFGVTQGAASEVNEVTFSGVDAACEGQAFYVDVLGASGAVLDDASGIVSLAGGSFSVTVSASAADVQGANVTITGAAATP